MWYRYDDLLMINRPRQKLNDRNGVLCINYGTCDTTRHRFEYTTSVMTIEIEKRKIRMKRSQRTLWHDRLHTEDTLVRTNSQNQGNERQSLLVKQTFDLGRVLKRVSFYGCPVVVGQHELQENELADIFLVDDFMQEA